MAKAGVVLFTRHLEHRVKKLMDDCDELKKYIESHDFGMAEVYAEDIVRGCQASNKLANRIADLDAD